MRRFLFLAVLVCLVAAPALAQDPVKVDPKHYKLVFENDQVRVLRIHYGPHEKSVMHEHPDSVAVMLADQKYKFTMPDGKTEEHEGKAGESMWVAAGKHLPEAVGDKPIEVVLVEMKHKMAAKPATKAPPPPPPKKKS
jgi:quercetin dioxygenase-like cupin family protein